MLNLDKLYDIREAAPFLGVKRTTIFRAIRSGQLRALKVGRATRLLGRDIAAFQTSLTPANPSPENR